MKRLIVRILPVLLFVVSGWSAQAQSKDDIKSAIAAVNQERIKLMKAGNFDGLEKFYENDAIVMPNNRPVERGTKAIMSSYNLRKNSNYKYLELQFNASDFVIADGLVVETGTYAATVSFTGPPEPVSEAGKYQTIWRLQKDGVWKIYSDIWNFDKSASAPQKKSGGIEVNPALVQPAPENKPVQDKNNQNK